MRNGRQAVSQKVQSGRFLGVFFSDSAELVGAARPQRFQLSDFVEMLCGQVVRFSPVAAQVVQLPRVPGGGDQLPIADPDGAMVIVRWLV